MSENREKWGRCERRFKQSINK